MPSIEALYSGILGALNSAGTNTVTGGINKLAEKSANTKVAAAISEEYGLNEKSARLVAKELRKLVESGEFEIGADEVRTALDGEDAGLTTGEQNSTYNTDLPDGVHSPAQLQTMKEYSESVNTELFDYAEIIEQTEGQDLNQYKPLSIAAPSERLLTSVKELTGVNTEGYGNEIMPSDMWHIFLRHGKKGVADHSMSDTRDIARIEYVLDNFDTIELQKDRSKGFFDSNGKPSKKVLISKRIDGTYYVVEAVPDTKRRKLEIVTAYKNKDTASQPPDGIKPLRSTPKAQTSNAVSELSISETGKNVNNSAENVNGATENVTADAVEQRAQRLGIAKGQAENVASPAASDAVKQRARRLGLTKGQVKAEARSADAAQRRGAMQAADAVKRASSELVYQTARAEKLTDAYNAARTALADSMRTELDRLNPDAYDNGDTVDKIITAYENGNANTLTAAERNLMTMQPAELKAAHAEALNEMVGGEQTLQDVTAELESAKQAAQTAETAPAAAQTVETTEKTPARTYRSRVQRLADNDIAKAGKKLFELFAVSGEENKANVKAWLIGAQEEYFDAGRISTQTEDGLYKALWEASGLPAEQYDGNLGSEQATAERTLHKEFVKAVDHLRNDLFATKRLSDSVTAVEAASAAPRMSSDELTNLNRRRTDAKKHYNAAKTACKLTRADLALTEDLARGKITEDMVTGQMKSEIIRIGRLGAEANALNKQYSEQRAYKKAELDLQSAELTENMGEWNAKRKTDRVGLAYDLNTPERNAQMLMTDADAKAWINEVFGKTWSNEANKQRWLKEIREKVKKLNLTARERELTQYLGEVEYGDPENGVQAIDAKAAEQLVRDKTLATDKEIQRAHEAVKVFREIYDGIFKQIEQVFAEFGYEAPAYRKGYFPHFSENGDTITNLANIILGTDVFNDVLRTDIAGRTETFKPGKPWFGNLQTRTDNKTVFDAVKGLEHYLTVAGDIIFHTEDIQFGRSLISTIRNKFSSDAIRAKIQEIMDDTTLSENERTAAIAEQNKLMDSASQLPGFIVWLEDYVNILAGKKHSGDRFIERDLGRSKAYTIARSAVSLIAGGMVSFNVRTGLTNFAPILLAAGQIQQKYLTQAMRESLGRVDNDFVDRSDFLSSRIGTGTLTETKLRKVGGWWLGVCDDFTAQTIVKGRYYQEIAAGKSEAEAMKIADQYARDLIADRSKGALPLIFEKRNLLSKLVTQFQVETLNTINYIAKDLPRYAKAAGGGGDWLAAYILSLLGYCVGANLYNSIARWLFGASVVLDPIRMVNEAVGQAAGGRLPDPVEAAEALFTGGDFIQKIDNGGVGEGLLNFASSVADETPILGPLATAWLGTYGTSNVRYPGISTLPDADVLKGLFTGDTTAVEAGLELGKSALSLAPGYSQGKKTVEGLDAYFKGGKYYETASGEKLAYTVDQNALNFVRAALFGKSSFPEAADYYESNAKPLTVKQTEVYEIAKDAGVDPDAAINAIQLIAALDGKGEDGETVEGLKKRRVREYIDSLSLSEDEKAALYSGYYSDSYAAYRAAEESLEKAEVFDALDADERAAVLSTYSAFAADTDNAAGTKNKEKAYRRYRAAEAAGIGCEYLILVSQNAGSTKQERYDYINTLPLPANDKLLVSALLWPEYSDVKNGKDRIFDIIDALDLSKKEKAEIWATIYG